MTTEHDLCRVCGRPWRTVEPCYRGGSHDPPPQPPLPTDIVIRRVNGQPFAFTREQIEGEAT